LNTVLLFIIGKLSVEVFFAQPRFATNAGIWCRCNVQGVDDVSRALIYNCTFTSAKLLFAGVSAHPYAALEYSCYTCFNSIRPTAGYIRQHQRGEILRERERTDR
jgi:hypothetical protein